MYEREELLQRGESLVPRVLFVRFSIRERERESGQYLDSHGVVLQDYLSIFLPKVKK